MAATNSNQRKWLRRAGLIIGLVWIVWGFIVFLVSVESPLTWIILGPIFLVFLAIITIAWKWQLVGAVALIVVGLFLVVQQITGWIWTAISGAIYNPLEMLAGALLAGGLPLASGILLLLSRKEGSVAKTRVGIVSPDWLASKRKVWIVIAFVLGAIITPTIDPLNQTIIAVPFIVLYELIIWLARLARRRKAD